LLALARARDPQEAKRRRRTELDNLAEDIAPGLRPPEPGHVRKISNPNNDAASAMSQRNRSSRGANRNNGNNHGEEAQLWDEIKKECEDLVPQINNDNDGLRELLKDDKKAGAMDPNKITIELAKAMDEKCRKGVKWSEQSIQSMKNIMDKLKILKAVVVAKESAEAQAAGPAKRAAATRETRETRESREKDNSSSAAAAAAASAPNASSTSTAAAASSLYDFDGAGDSPVPSPVAGSSSRKGGDRSSNRDRDSVPPRTRTDSVEPQGSGSGLGSVGTPGAAGNKSKVVFSKGDAVAFKPKVVSGEQTSDWILGEVALVLGEGKSRRYKVLDVEPDDHSKQKEYRTSASSMIPITPESQASTLKDWEPGKIVLALYPQTTTFYKAEVDNMGDDGKVNLKFEGENDLELTQQVERRFVIEYRQ
jgi:SAGA-associated factor 29